MVEAATNKETRSSFGLQSQLVFLLLAFGVIPVTLAITVGYAVSRGTILGQSELALGEYATRQAGHFETELARQRLLLRTITGQLTNPLSRDRDELGKTLEAGLADDGVFDGLRLVTHSGTLVSDVTLGNSAPHWPGNLPATDWTEDNVFVHRTDSQVIAYLIATPVVLADGRGWLEGHVSVIDFNRLFDMNLHPIGGVEQGILNAQGLPIVVSHPHSTEELRSFLQPSDAMTDHTAVRSGGAISITAPIAGTDWNLVAFLPLSIALSPMRTLIKASAIGLLVLTVLIVLAAQLVSRVVTTPLRDLALAALDFGTTNSYKPIRPGTVRETATLVHSFDRMASDLLFSQEHIAKLHDKELERAQQLATVGELASGIAHEIRNPLTGVLGALDLAGRSLPKEDNAHPLIEESKAQLKRIDDATNQLLQYARPPDLRTLPVDLNLVVQRAVAITTPRAEAAGVSVRHPPARETAQVNADPELLVQVFVNLMLNGIQAAGEGGHLIIKVSLTGSNVAVTISDDGPGIPPDKRSQIFKPFYTTKSQGTGLGLPISNQIVARHGGELRVLESRDGAAVCVVLPALEVEETS